MKILVDMNLSPDWVSWLKQSGHEAIHWSVIGNSNAADRDIMRWARKTGHIVFTHDLDFSAILAATDADAPSVIQIRTQDVTPDHCGNLLVNVLRRYESELSKGVLISVDEDRARIRLLPLKP